MHSDLGIRCHPSRDWKKFFHFMMSGILDHRFLTVFLYITHVSEHLENITVSNTGLDFVTRL